MSAYEILKRLSKYTLLIDHMAAQKWPCSCTASEVCCNCDQRALYEELQDIMCKVGKYVF